LTPEAFRAAGDIAQQAQSGTVERLDHSPSWGKGALVLRVLDFAINDQISVRFAGGVIDRVIIGGESCVLNQLRCYCADFMNHKRPADLALEPSAHG